MDYLVRWEIELSAENPVTAAIHARSAQLRRKVRATVFDVFSENDDDAVRVDLTALADEMEIPEPKAQGVFSARELAAVLNGLKLLGATQPADEMKGAGVALGFEYSPYKIDSPASQLGEQPRLSKEEIDRLSKWIEVTLA